VSNSIHWEESEGIIKTHRKQWKVERRQYGRNKKMGLHKVFDELQDSMNYEDVSKSFGTESITKHTLTTINTC
jgi:hypothetical protein